jgi:hypothetical protein
MREKLPRITSLKVLANHRLSLHFQDGWTVIVALGAFIDACPVLAPLRDRTLFRKAKLEEWGSGVTWDDEGPLSIAATTLYRLAAEQAEEPARRFDAWMISNGLSATRAAEALGMTRRSIISYRTGARPVPTYINLACIGWEVSRDGAREKPRAH